MNISQVINQETNPVNAKLCEYGYKEFTSLTDAAQVASGSSIHAEGYQSAIINVTGDFVADVVVMPNYAGTAFGTLQVKNLKSGEVTKVITSAGCYIVDLSGVAAFRVRVNAYTSGTVSAAGLLLGKPLSENTISGGRNVLLATAFGVTVPANTSNHKVIEKVDVRKYPYNYITVRASSGTITSKLYYSSSVEGDLGAPVPAITVMEEVLTRGASEWIEAKGNIVSVLLDNNSDAEQTYDVYLYGVG